MWRTKLGELNMEEKKAAKRKVMRYRRSPLLICALFMILIGAVVRYQSPDVSAESGRTAKDSGTGAGLGRKDLATEDGVAQDLASSTELGQSGTTDQQLSESDGSAGPKGGDGSEADSSGSSPRQGTDSAAMTDKAEATEEAPTGQEASLEERKRVSQSLEESGDDDHEAEPIILNPAVTSKRHRDKIGEEKGRSLNGGGGEGGGGESSGGDNDSSEVQTKKKKQQQVHPGLDLEKIPFAGLVGVDASLSVGDGSCPEAAVVTAGATNPDTLSAMQCGSHGFCASRKCVCTISYTGPQCSSPRRPFARKRAHFNHRFLLSVSQVRRKKEVRYPMLLPQSGWQAQLVQQQPKREGQQHPQLVLPFDPAGKVNRVVWAHLQKEKLHELEDPVLSVALLDLLPGSDLLQNALFNSCAVVGNSGLNSFFDLGPAIDAHDVVFRLTRGPTTNATSATSSTSFPLLSVGRRTSIRIVDEDSMAFSEEGEIRIMNVDSVHGLFKHFYALNKDPTAKAYLLNPDFSNYVAENTGAQPSPTTIAFFLALQRCASVTVYGVHWKFGLGAPFNYFSDETIADEETQNSRDAEAALVESFAKRELVALGQPCAGGCEAESGIPCRNCPGGSSCACGRNVRVPVALPGFCHLPGNFSCFFTCDASWGTKCKGGPEFSLCPDGADTSRLQCTTSQESGLAGAGTKPWWTIKDRMRSFDGKFDRATAKARVAEEKKRRARKREEGRRKRTIGRTEGER